MPRQDKWLLEVNMDLTEDRQGKEIPAWNDFDVTWSPLSLTSWTPTVISIALDEAEIVLMPIWADLKVWKDNPLTWHDLVPDWAKEVFWVVRLAEIFVESTADCLVYFRKVQL